MVHESICTCHKFITEYAVERFFSVNPTMFHEVTCMCLPIYEAPAQIPAMLRDMYHGIKLLVNHVGETGR